jgi:hypothetical protein
MTQGQILFVRIYLIVEVMVLTVVNGVRQLRTTSQLPCTKCIAGRRVMCATCL